ncbi:hypothetical protein BJX99DRAFT_261772 [Aspergillus californicus]
MSNPCAGLEWKEGFYQDKPSWVKEPELNSVARVVESHLHNETDIQVSFFSEGSFNKLYTVEMPSSNQAALMMRVSLPVDSKYKTLSEAATLAFVKANTRLENPLLGQESDYREIDCWASGRYHRNQISVNWNLYQAADISGADIINNEKEYAIGRISAQHFFWAEHYEMDVPRGPFPSSRAWISSQLLLYEKDAEIEMKNAENGQPGSWLKGEKSLQRTVLALQRNLDAAFPPEEDNTETYTLYHHDISFQNILADAGGRITGLVDWECVNIVPTYKSMENPSCLVGPDSDLDDYLNPDEYLKINGSVEENDLYREAVLEYELTKLRPIFIDEMKRLSSEWVRVHGDEKLRLKADFEFAVQICAFWRDRNIEDWIEGLEKGEIEHLKEFY